MIKKTFRIAFTIVSSLPILAVSSYLFAESISPDDLRATLFTLSLEQLHLLLLVVVCLIVLYELADEYRVELVIRNALTPLTSTTTVSQFLARMAWLFVLFLLSLLGIVIPFLDLLGSIPFAVFAGFKVAAPKIALLLLTTAYVYHLISRTELLQAKLSNVIMRAGSVEVLDREHDHAFMARAIDEISVGGTIYVTHFEEPQNPMNPKGYYYENDFMDKWYSTIREKKLKVTQIVSVNSRQDIEDLKSRLSLVKDIPTFSIAFIICPPLTVFVDFMVVPGTFALVGFSDNPGARNMNEYSVLLRGGEGIGRFEHLFTDVLLPEATHVKTFEGINQVALKQLLDKADVIARSSSRVLKDLFDF